MKTYKEAGVDVIKGDLFVEKIKTFIRPTYNKKVISGVGGFCALYEVSPDKWLAAGTDGVGTKVKLAQELNQHLTIGHDLVAMCVNDIICSGATPAFFLDYLATGVLDIEIHSDIVQGIADACLLSECALIGGETAEMPGVYSDGVYDLAGFCVGELHPKDHISGKNIRAGDVLIGLFSSGFHSNGYSLIRTLLNNDEIDLKKNALTPTRIYWKVLKKILANQRENILGLAHITGGGFENIPRMNDELGYVINQIPTAEHRTKVMNVLIERSKLAEKELFETFNMGIGFVICVRDELLLKDFLSTINEPCLTLGFITNDKQGLQIMN